MRFDLDALENPAELARLLAVQAETLALNAAIEAARGGPQAGELASLAQEARALSRQARDAADQHRRLAQAEQAAGRILDEGLARGPIELADGTVLRRDSRATASRLKAGARRAEESVVLLH